MRERREIERVSSFARPLAMRERREIARGQLASPRGSGAAPAATAASAATAPARAGTRRRGPTGRRAGGRAARASTPCPTSGGCRRQPRAQTGGTTCACAACATTPRPSP
eukprot:4198437-Prymnesium_polylepis.1